MKNVLVVLVLIISSKGLAQDQYTKGVQRALALAPENPRVVFSKAEWDMGSARYFGKDITPYCKDVERSLLLFATFKPEGDFYPNWGEERAKAILKQRKQ